MDGITFERLEARYSRVASWAIWDPDSPLDTAIISQNLETLKTSVVMVGLNVSRFLPSHWRNFHSRDHARKLMFAFNQSPYRGAYMTDLIKEEIEPDSARLSERIRNQNMNLIPHIEAFRREMNDTGVEDSALFILFGRKVTRLFKMHLGKTYPNHVSCPHYSMYGKGYTDAEWVAKTWRILEEHHRTTGTTFNTLEFSVSGRMKVELDTLQKRRLLSV